MKKILLISLLFPFLSFSQSWIDMMQDPSNNFYDTQKEFEDYWRNKTIEKGKGWKQFKRWENFIRPRVFPDGIQHPELLFQESQINNHTFNMNPPNIWSQIGPDNVPLESSGRKRGIGRVNTIAFHPTNPNIIYIGAPAGGFWKSINGGQTWETTTDFLTNLGVSDIAINPNNPDEIYVITNGEGILNKSGKLEKMLEKIASLYDNEIKNNLSIIQYISQDKMKVIYLKLSP